MPIEYWLLDLARELREEKRRWRPDSKRIVELKNRLTQAELLQMLEED